MYYFANIIVDRVRGGHRCDEDTHANTHALALSRGCDLMYPPGSLCELNDQSPCMQSRVHHCASQAIFGLAGDVANVQAHHISPM